MHTLVSSKTQSWLSWFLRGLLILGFLVLVGRLIELQIIKGQYYRTLSEGNRIRRVPIVAPRGNIIARGGEILVGNKEVKKKVTFDPEKGYEKTIADENTNTDEVVGEWERDYEYGWKFAHVSGYLSEVNDEELGKVNPLCPDKGPRKLGSLVGRAGLEAEYECQLAGSDGEELVEVDTTGKMVRILGKKAPIKGADLYTSIDAKLQEKMAEEMNGKKGAAIATDAKGRVLALFSYPSFDPNILIQKNQTETVETLLADPNLPFFNRAISGIYHPGSTFKPIVAIAALEEGKIDENYKFNDPGVITIGTFSYANWYFSQYGSKEGEIGIKRAISRSTDTFFYKLGEFVGVDNLDKWAVIFGLGQKTEIDLPGETVGLVPTPEWKERVKGERWFLGNTYHISIGQGDLALTPVEVNRAILGVATGQLCDLSIGRDSECKDLVVRKENLKIVREGMVGACSLGGTGFTFFDFEPRVACKTGTAETNIDGKTHAWFSVFAPVDFPQVVMTVLVEGGGEGSKVAGPVARKLFDFIYDKNL